MARVDSAPDSVWINGVEVAPGSRATVDLPLPGLYTHTEWNLPVGVVCGRRPGPRLLITAAVHGDEINGVEIIRRLLAMPLLRRLRGALITVPVVNIYGFIAHSRYLPDRRDLNRSFPGSETGSLTGRLAHQLLAKIVSAASHAVDLHTGAIHRSNLPQIRADLSKPDIRELALAFGTPVVLDSEPMEGSLRRAAGIPMLVYEGGEALRFDELAIRAGVRGLVAVMRKLGMLPAVKARKTPVEPVIARGSSWMRAPQSGIMRAAKSMGARVDRDETLAIISDPFGGQESLVPARFSGIIIGRSNLPLINEGEALFHVARVPRPGELEESVERYHEQLVDMEELADPADTTL